MSDTNLTKKITELSLQQRRSFQFQIMKRWDQGKLTGKQCIEEILSLENVLYVNPQQIKELKEKYEGSESNTQEDKKH